MTDPGIVEGSIPLLPPGDGLCGSVIVTGGQDNGIEPFFPEEFAAIVHEDVMMRCVKDDKTAITVIVEQAW